MKERELLMCESQSFKTYEHVGMADNYQRLRSDERQTKNDEKSVIKDHKSMKEQRLKTILQRHTKLKTKNTEDPLTWSIIRMTTP